MPKTHKKTPKTTTITKEPRAKRSAPAVRYIGRTEAAQLLGVTRATICRMEDRGDLHPKITKGVHRFAESEVLEIKSRQPPRERTAGEIAALAFGAFDTGRTIKDVVRELAIDPATAARLRWYWGSDDSSLCRIVAAQRAARETERQHRLDASIADEQRTQDLHEVRLAERAERAARRTVRQ